jgi:hypothetical protein
VTRICTTSKPFTTTEPHADRRLPSTDSNDAGITRESSCGSEAAFDVQMHAIAEHVDLDQLRPRIVDPFTARGSLRPA